MYVVVVDINPKFYAVPSPSSCDLKVDLEFLCLIDCVGI